ncbi:integral component of membrane [Sergentomyia squamirostris]
MEARGQFIPRANSKGAIIGAFTTILSLLVLIIGNTEKTSDPQLPLRRDGCLNVFNTALRRNSTESNESEGSERYQGSEVETTNFWLFNLSYIYYGLVGTVVGVLTGYLVSVLTGGKEIKNQKLLATFLRKTVFSEEETKLHPLNIS